MQPDVRNLGQVDYLSTYQAMQDFTTARDDTTPDALWICEHRAVYTQGLAGKADHILNPAAIPVVQTNRGGQVTFHGPGQVVAYPLIDLRRAGYYVKEYVHRIEESVIRTLAHFGVTGHRVAGAPGIYVRLDDPFSHAALSGPAHPSDPFRGLGKIAALGIKVSRHCTYHGIWRWTWNPSRVSTLAATPGCTPQTFLQSAYRLAGRRRQAY
jgi:lipoyl(octanoyl) transferase